MKLHDLLQRGNEEIKFPGAIRKTIDAIIDHFGAETRSRWPSLLVLAYLSVITKNCCNNYLSTNTRA